MLKGWVAVSVASVCVMLVSVPANAQGTKETTQRFAIRAARLIDGKNETVMKNAVVLVEGEKITAVGSGLAAPADAKVIELADATLLPGLIDAHTHLLLEMDGTNLTLQDVAMLRMVATQSTAERALLGAKLGREDLEAGITTVRDVGNSGSCGTGWTIWVVDTRSAEVDRRGVRHNSRSRECAPSGSSSSL
jgi:hypothetical protein